MVEAFLVKLSAYNAFQDKKHLVTKIWYGANRTDRTSCGAPALFKKKIKQLHSHLRNKHSLSAKQRRPYMKIARDSGVKHKDTV